MTDTPAPDPADALADALAARTAELERRLAELEARATARAVSAALAREARRAGMIDLDSLRLADTSALRPNEQGEVDGAAALVAGLRQSKPYLFAAASSSSAATPPPATPPAPRLATAMSVDEWRTARAELLRRR